MNSLAPSFCMSSTQNPLRGPNALSVLHTQGPLSCGALSPMQCGGQAKEALQQAIKVALGNDDASRGSKDKIWVGLGRAGRYKTDGELVSTREGVGSVAPVG
jgi:hypothetical protein